MFTGPLLQLKLQLLSAVLLSGFQSSGKLWNPLSKAVPGKFHGFGWHSKCKCLQDWANLHRSWAWQIVLIFKTVKWWPIWLAHGWASYRTYLEVWVTIKLWNWKISVTVTGIGLMLKWNQAIKELMQEQFRPNINSLRPGDGTKPMLLYQQWCYVSFTWDRFHKKCS